MKLWLRIISGRKYLSVYRTHDKPDSEKIAKLSTFINNFGYTLHIGADEVHPKELQKLLDEGGSAQMKNP